MSGSGSIVREVGRLCVDIRDQAMLGLLDLATEREVRHLRQRLQTVHQLALIGLAELEAMRGDERLSGSLTGSLDTGDVVEELKRGMCEKCLMSVASPRSPSPPADRLIQCSASGRDDRAAVPLSDPKPAPASGAASGAAPGADGNEAGEP